MPAQRATIASIIAAIALLMAYVALLYLPRASVSEGGVILASTTPAECREPSMIAALTGLREASGLATSRKNPGLLWSHNDSADAVLYGVGHDGAIKTRIRVTGAAVDDWEAVTTGSCPQGSCVYIGDIGDNKAIRPRVTIYRTTEPAVTETATAPVDAFSATYPEGPQDAEALFATADGTLYIVTKGDGVPVHVYRVPALTAGTLLRLTRIATLTTDLSRRSSDAPKAEASKAAHVTDAALSPDGDWVVLRTNHKLFFYKTTDLTNGGVGPPREFDLARLKEPQGEGIAWARDNTLYLAGEGGRGGTLARVSCTVN